MDAYLDEEILKKKEGLKKRKYNNLENGYYVAGRIIHFTEEIILESFFMHLPDNMGIMPDEVAKIRYPSEFRPQIILTIVNMGFNVFERQIQEGEMKAMVRR